MGVNGRFSLHACLHSPLLKIDIFQKGGRGRYPGTDPCGGSRGHGVQRRHAVERSAGGTQCRRHAAERSDGASEGSDAELRRSRTRKAYMDVKAYMDPLSVGAFTIFPVAPFAVCSFAQMF